MAFAPLTASGLPTLHQPPIARNSSSPTSNAVSAKRALHPALHPATAGVVGGSVARGAPLAPTRIAFPTALALGMPAAEDVVEVCNANSYSAEGGLSPPAPEERTHTLTHISAGGRRRLLCRQRRGRGLLHTSISGLIGGYGSYATAAHIAFTAATAAPPPTLR